MTTPACPAAASATTSLCRRVILLQLVPLCIEFGFYRLDFAGTGRFSNL